MCLVYLMVLKGMKAELYVTRKTETAMQLHGSHTSLEIKDKDVCYSTNVMRKSVCYHCLSLDNKIVCMVVVYLKTRQK
jgi:hypothetical protein